MQVPEKTWNQSHYDDAKEIMGDIEGIEFNGPGSAMSQQLEFVVGKKVTYSDVQRRVDEVVEAFTEAETPPVKVYLEGGYAGAMNAALLLVLEFEP